MAYYDRAIAHGGTWYFYAQRGRGYRCLKRYDEALADLNRSLSTNPQDVTTLDLRASLHSRMKNDDAAMRDLNHVLALDSHYPRALRKRGKIYYKRKQPKRAIRDLETSLYYAPGSAFAHRTLGQVHQFLVKNPRRAIEHSEQAIAINESDRQSWYGITTAHYALKQCDFIDAGEEYLSLCTKARCGRKQQDWVSRAVREAKAGGYC